ncbi:MAG: prolyl oligopeptidase family serine peptidase [Planctomycetota bacterium]|nr:prolyl oligopeptidase family serine peptidase [Planctomycetota bacterium]
MSTSSFLLLAAFLSWGWASALAAGEPAAPAGAGASWGEPRDVEFVSALDGSTQRYVELLPQGFDAKEPHALMLALHGHGSDRWQYIRQDRGECKGARDTALKYRMIFVSPDYRAPDSWMGPAAEADVLQILAAQKRERRIAKVFLVGGSMGGAGVLTFTCLHPDQVDGAVSENGMANLVEYAGFQGSRTRTYGGDVKAKSEEYRKRSAEFFPERFTMPLAFTTGGKDTAVPPESVLRLSQALRKLNPKVLHLHRENGGHSTSYADTVEALEFVIQAVLNPQEAGKK